MAPSTTEDTSKPSTSSGIITLSSGERAIPSSTRSDGSKRKEIRVRPGYKPPEDVEVYKNRTAQAFKNRGTGGIPGADDLEEKDEQQSGGKGGTNKNAKRREARKRAKEAAEAEGEGQGDGESKEVAAVEAAKENGVNGEQKELEKPQSQENGVAAGQKADEQVERLKRARKLKKKLREARKAHDKKERGETLLQEESEKVIRIDELVRDLEELGFNADGEPTGE
ncbi:hypothetical protein MMC10_004779 [Thelotrema lepadinum]|nr:hypothetical protein [Thelotrema lepadinum]